MARNIKLSASGSLVQIGTHLAKALGSIWNSSESVSSVFRGSPSPQQSNACWNSISSLCLAIVIKLALVGWKIYPHTARKFWILCPGFPSYAFLSAFCYKQSSVLYDIKKQTDSSSLFPTFSSRHFIILHPLVYFLANEQRTEDTQVLAAVCKPSWDLEFDWNIIFLWVS